MAGGEVYRELGEAAWAWVLRQVREDGGPWLPEVVAEDGRPTVPGVDRDSLYAGIGGLAPVLAEIRQCRAVSDAEQALAAGVAARLSVTAGTRTDASLYTGLGGDVTALKLLAPGSERIALGRLADLMTPSGWNTPPETGTGAVAPVTDLVLGTAGVVLAAVWADGEHARDIAATGGEALLEAADQTKDGLDWAMLPGWPSRMPNYSHGTAGIATALAIAGVALNRDDFIAAARQGADAARAAGSSLTAGHAEAMSFAHQAGSGYLLGPSAWVRQVNAATISVTVYGHVPSFVPGLTVHVHETVQVPVEVFHS